MTIRQSPQTDSTQLPPQGSAEKPIRGEAAALAASKMGVAAMNEGQAALKEIQAGSREWMGWAQGAYRANLGAWQALVGCRTVQAAAAIHANLMQEHLRLLMDNGRRTTIAMAKSTRAKSTGGPRDV